MRDMIRGDQYQGKLEVGQRIHSILYGGRDGVICKITGDQRPETIKRFGGGCMGGAANIDVVFDEYVSRGIPEGIIRGVQWHISDEVVLPQEIMAMMDKAALVVAEKKETERKEQEARDTLRGSLPAKYPYLTQVAGSGKSSHAIGAKNLKIELGRAFPKTKFYIKSQSYSGGDSIRVGWTDGPTQEEVEKVSSKYQEGSFDGMEDIYNYDHSNVWPDVFGGAKYVNESRTESQELIIKAAKELGHDLMPEMFDRWGNINCAVDTGIGIGESWDERKQRIYREARKMSCI